MQQFKRLAGSGKGKEKSGTVGRMVYEKAGFCIECHIYDSNISRRYLCDKQRRQCQCRLCGDSNGLCSQPDCMEQKKLKLMTGPGSDRVKNKRGNVDTFCPAVGG